MLYLTWRMCERWGVLPSGIKTPLDINEPWLVSLLLAYEQVRELEETMQEESQPNRSRKRKRKR